MKGTNRLAILCSLLLAPVALGGVIPLTEGHIGSGDAEQGRQHHASPGMIHADAGTRGRGIDLEEGAEQHLKRMGQPLGFPTDADDLTGVGGVGGGVQYGGSADSGLANPPAQPGSGKTANVDAFLSATPADLPVPDAPTLAHTSTTAVSSLDTVETSKVQALPTIASTVVDHATELLPTATSGNGDGTGKGGMSSADESTALSTLAGSDSGSATMTSEAVLSATSTAAVTPSPAATPPKSGSTAAQNAGGVQEPVLPDPPTRSELPIPEPPPGLGGTGGGSSSPAGPQAEESSVPSTPKGPAPSVPDAASGGTGGSPGSGSSSGTGSSSPPSGSSTSSGSSGSSSMCSASAKPAEAIGCLLEASPKCTVPGGGCGVLVELKPYIKTDTDACKDFVTLSAQVCAQCGGTQELYDLYNAYLTQCGSQGSDASGGGGGTGGGGAGAGNLANGSAGGGPSISPTPGSGLDPLPGSEASGQSNVTTGGLQTADESLMGPNSGSDPVSGSSGIATASRPSSTPSPGLAGTPTTDEESGTSAANTAAETGAASPSGLTSGGDASSLGSGGDGVSSESRSTDAASPTQTTDAQKDARESDYWYDAGVKAGHAADREEPSVSPLQSTHTGSGTSGGDGGSGSDPQGQGSLKDSTETGAVVPDPTLTGATSKTPQTPAPVGAGSTPKGDQMDGGVQANERMPPPDGTESDSTSDLRGPTRTSDPAGTALKNAKETGASDGGDVGVKTGSSTKASASKNTTIPALMATRDFFQYEIDTACAADCQHWVDAYKVCKEDADALCMCTDKTIARAGECSSCMGKAGRSAAQIYRKQMQAYQSFRTSCPGTTGSGGLGGAGGDACLDPVEDVAEATPSNDADSPTSTGKSSKGKKLLEEEDLDPPSSEETESAGPVKSSTKSSSSSESKVSSERAEAAGPAPKPDAALGRPIAGWLSVVMVAVGAIVLGEAM